MIEIACLALAIYFEARSEPIHGRIAVAETVLNRVEKYPTAHCADFLPSYTDNNTSP